MLHFGILAGQDKILEAGDNFTDPFNALDVKDICIDKEFAVLFNYIDYNKLHKVKQIFPPQKRRLFLTYE